MRRASVVFALALSFVGCSERAVDPEQRAHAIEARVWSPYCPGRLLVDCTTRQARELRADILERTRDGDSEAEVLAWVRDQYGAAAIAQPDARGTGLILWLAPVLFFAVGGGLVVRTLRRSRRNAGMEPSLP